MNTFQTFTAPQNQIALAFRTQFIFVVRILLGSLGIVIGAILVGKQEVFFIGLSGSILILVFTSILFTEPVRLAFRIAWNPHRQFQIKLNELEVSQDIEGEPHVHILRNEVEKIIETSNGMIIQSSAPKRFIVIPHVLVDYKKVKTLLKPWGITETKTQRKKLRAQFISRPLALLRLLLYIPFALALAWQSGQIAILLFPALIGLLSSQIVDIMLISRVSKEMN